MRSPLLLAVAGLMACADMPSAGDGVVELRVERPASTNLVQGTSIQLHATAYGRDGLPADADIVWVTPDSTITVEATTGLVTGVAASGNGRVQATVGSLRSEVITFILQPPPDTDPET